MLDMAIQRITSFLWFSQEAEEAALYYTGIFQHSQITAVTKYGEAGKDMHKQPPGSVMTVAFELDGMKFTAINGGPAITFNQAVSFVVTCETQDELDYYWAKLSAGGEKQAQQCGWLKDKYGLSWQVVPAILIEMLKDTDYQKSERVMEAMMTMKKIAVATLLNAFAGEVQPGEPAMAI